MRLLDRYLFRELLTPLAFCLGGFLIFWISADAFKSLSEFQDDKLRLPDIVEYYLAMTPEFLGWPLLPIALLLALLYTLTNHARHNEITAIRAAGVSLLRLCVPYLAVGLTASVVLFWLNEWCVPRSANWAERIKSRYVQKPDDTKTQKDRFFFNDPAGRTWMFFELRFKSAELIRPQVNWDLPGGENCQLNAEHAIYTNGAWTFFDVSVKEIAQVNGQLVSSLQTNVLAMPEFIETPKEIQSEIKIGKYLSLNSMRKADIPLADLLGYLQRHPDLSRAAASRLLTKLHGRLAAPWTCLVVVLIAIPFGAASGRRNLFVGVAGSIFICFAYFIIQQVSLALGSSGRLPPWLAAWLPNIIFGATGLVLTARVR